MCLDKVVGEITKLVKSCSRRSIFADNLVLFQRLRNSGKGLNRFRLLHSTRIWSRRLNGLNSFTNTSNLGEADSEDLFPSRTILAINFFVNRSTARVESLRNQDELPECNIL